MLFETKIYINSKLSLKDLRNIIDDNKGKLKYTETIFSDDEISIYSDFKDDQKSSSITFFEGTFIDEINGGVKLIGKVKYFNYFKIAFGIILIFSILSIIKTNHILPSLLTVFTTIICLIIYLQIEKKRYLKLICLLINKTL